MVCPPFLRRLTSAAYCKRESTRSGNHAGTAAPRPEGFPSQGLARQARSTIPAEPSDSGAFHCLVLLPPCQTGTSLQFSALRRTNQPVPDRLLPSQGLRSLSRAVKPAPPQGRGKALQFQLLEVRATRATPVDIPVTASSPRPRQNRSAANSISVQQPRLPTTRFPPGICCRCEPTQHQKQPRFQDHPSLTHSARHSTQLFPMIPLSPFSLRAPAHQQRRSPPATPAALL